MLYLGCLRIDYGDGRVIRSSSTKTVIYFYSDSSKYCGGKRVSFLDIGLCSIFISCRRK